MKSKWLALGMAALALAGLGAFAACGDGGSAGGEGGAGGGTAVSYSVSCEEDDVFGDYYNLDADYSKVGAGKTVTVTVSDAWNFISVSKVYANGTECAAGSEAGEFTFTMPEKDVTVTAEVTVNAVAEGDYGMAWTSATLDFALSKEDDLSSGVQIAEDTGRFSLTATFGTRSVQNQVTANDDGYGTLTSCEVISTNEAVIPSDAVTRLNGGNFTNGSLCSGVTIEFDTERLARGTTTIILIDTDNTELERAITIDVTITAAQ